MSRLTKGVRTLLLALLTVGCASCALALAQAQKQPASGGPQITKESPKNPGGPGRQLVHESREAAGEDKDDTAEFKQSASVQLISRWTGLDVQRSYWLSVITNFVVIAAILLWVGRKFLPGIFRDRTASIQKAMQEAQRAGEEARR